jgi:hypothetical protein
VKKYLKNIEYTISFSLNIDGQIFAYKKLNDISDRVIEISNLNPAPYAGSMLMLDDENMSSLNIVAELDNFMKENYTQNGINLLDAETIKQHFDTTLIYENIVSAAGANAALAVDIAAANLLSDLDPKQAARTAATAAYNAAVTVANSLTDASDKQTALDVAYNAYLAANVAANSLSGVSAKQAALDAAQLQRSSVRSQATYLIGSEIPDDPSKRHFAIDMWKLKSDLDPNKPIVFDASYELKKCSLIIEIAIGARKINLEVPNTISAIMFVSGFNSIKGQNSILSDKRKIDVLANAVMHQVTFNYTVLKLV